MDLGDCVIIDKDNFDVTDVHFQSQNQQSSEFDEINQIEHVTRKSELKKILQTVSVLCKPNPIEIAEFNSDDTCKIIGESLGNMTDATDIQEIKKKKAVCEREVEIMSVKLLKKDPLKVPTVKSNDSDEIEIIDVLILNTNHQKKNSKKCKKRTSINNPSQNGSSSVEDDLIDIQEIKTENDTYEGDVEMMSVNLLKEDFFDVPATKQANSVSKECISSNSSDTHSSPLSNALKESDEHCPKKQFNVKAAIENIDIMEHETLEENAMCNEIVAHEILDESAMCDEIVEPETLTDSDTSYERVEPETLTDSSMCGEIVEHETLTDSSVCGEIVEQDTLDVNTMCNKIVEYETLDSSDVCDDNEDLTKETNGYSHNVEYDFNHTPIQITGSWKEFHDSKKNNFTKGCKWAPDGSCIMTCSDDNKLRLFNLPPQLWNSSEWSDISELETALRISEGDLIYDYCWYPLMNSNDAATCCFISTSRKSTVHLWDAYTGELRCSYRSFNHLDELVTPHSLCFDSDGNKIFCGFQNVIRVFDVNRPGRFCEERQIYAYKTGQCGIISCFAFTSADKNISAAGSYLKTIGLYAEPYGELSCLLEGQANGVTQLQFSPDGKYLYSGGRKDPEILCWDLRNLGTVLFSLRRSCETNQRIYFDISRCGKYVVSGNQNGVITFWDVTKEPKIINEDDFPVLVPLQFYLAHDDCVNGISFHPSYPLLCSSSGQRKFPVLLDEESDDIFSSESEKQDNSLRLWWIGKLNR